MSKKDTVEIICVMDRSGSMSGITKEAVNAFNRFVEDQKKLPGKAKLTLVAFDDQYEVIHDRVKLKDVPMLTEGEVFARGMTALNDAVGKAINRATDAKKVICLIQTDGFENSSHEYSSNQIKSLVEEKTDAGWEFHFIGAGIDAFAQSAQFGISRANTFSVSADAKGMDDYSERMSVTSTAYRTGAST